MSLVMAEIRGSTPTSGTTVDYTISGSVTPKFYRVICGVGVTNGTEAVHGVFSRGAGDGTNERCHSIFSEDNSTRTDTYGIGRTDASVVVLDGTGAIAGQLSFNSFINSGGNIGVRFNVDTAFAAAYVIQVEIGYGDGVEAWVGDHGTILDAQSATLTPGFRTDFGWSFGGEVFSTGSSSTHAKSNDGFFRAWPTIQQACVSWYDPDNKTSGGGGADCRAILRYGYSAGNPSTAIYGFVSSITSTQVVVSNPGGGSVDASAWLLVKAPGVQAAVLNTQTPTGTPPFLKVDECGFLPFHVSLALSTCSALNTERTDGEASTVGIGACSNFGGTSTDGCFATREEDAAANPTNAGSLTNTTVCHMLNPAGSADVYKANFGDWQLNGPRYNWQSVDGTTQRYYAFMVLGEDFRLPDTPGPESMGLPLPGVVAY